ncbi:restriction endonuclease subunit S [Faecalibacterium prausnitzii]|uniref:restriction endonuclease subunit S n=1 Tax=Faecalibacterium prausnitzii TaxID=853 RepID=UPI00291337D3|nr:restriction endonuclease subunit S [Faecalibacterium prausnitzii]MDU8667019.1 restriction endonuclease subunit S [Faecalibacterium prausnitzii]
MTPEQLKSSILQYAIQGKLVEQRPEEGTGEELYQQIQTNLDAISEVQTKKKNKILPIEEKDVPFDIPETWRWVRLGTIGYTNIGLTYSPKDQTMDGVIVLRSSNIQNGKMVYEDIVKVNMEIPDNKMCQIGDILICARNGSKRLVGKSAIVDKAGMSFGAFMAIFRSVCNQYIIHVINSAYFRNSLLGDTGTTTINQITQDMLKNSLIPLPPLAEQKRIVAKIEELLPLVDRYAVAYEKLEQFNTKFPEDMKKSILQYAIQGKLVEQRPEEGTGEELYWQIQTEKQRLVKEGKIKKEKPLPEIAEEEVPFDIPESWKWVRLSQLAILENGDRSSKYPVESDYVDFGIPFFGAKDMNGSAMSLENVRYISEKKFSELGNGKLKNKDFICLLRGSVGKCAAFIADEKHRTGFICAQMVIVRCIDKAICDYMQKFLMSPFYSQYIESKVTGTAVRQLPAKELGNVLVPLPPLAEQTRIVAKLEELLPLCERLK